MSIEYQNKSEVSVGTDELSITIPVPVGFSAGDLLIACIVVDGTLTMSTPAGWTLIQKDSPGIGCYFGVFYRIAELGDTEWTWTCAIKQQFYGVILRYTGQADSGFIHASDITAESTPDTTPTAPDVSYTDLEAGSLCLQVFGADDDETPYTTPVQLTERYNGVSGTGTATCGGAGGDKVISGTGSTGIAEFTMNVKEEWVAITVVIEAKVGIITKTFEDTFSGTDGLLANKNLIFLDSMLGTDDWTLPELIRKIFSDVFVGSDNFLRDLTALFEDTLSGTDIFKADKMVIFSDTLSGVDVFLLDKEAKFEDVFSAIEKFYASYPYPRDLKRKIIIIRDIK